jgi:hypothetical protein
MSAAARAVGIAFAGVLPLCACTVAPVTVDAPRAVGGYGIAPYALHEECLKLDAGDRVEYAFESTEPVDFNIHFHQGKTVVMPVVREKSRGDAGVYASPDRQDYCLMWEAGAAGASIDYRIRMRPAAR